MEEQEEDNSSNSSETPSEDDKDKDDISVSSDSSSSEDWSASSSETSTSTSDIHTSSDSDDSFWSNASTVDTNMSPRKKLSFNGERGKFEGFMDDYESSIGVMNNWDDQVTTSMPDDKPEMGYAADLDEMDKKDKKKAKKCLKMHKKVMCELKLAVASNVIKSGIGVGVHSIRCLQDDLVHMQKQSTCDTADGPNGTSASHSTEILFQIPTIRP